MHTTLNKRNQVKFLLPIPLPSTFKAQRQKTIDISQVLSSAQCYCPLTLEGFTSPLQSQFVLYPLHVLGLTHCVLV